MPLVDVLFVERHGKVAVAIMLASLVTNRNTPIDRITAFDASVCMHENQQLAFCVDSVIACEDIWWWKKYHATFCARNEDVFVFVRLVPCPFTFHDHMYRISQ
jgi:hypothetical protein